ncbi:MAG: alpha/beta fold hydrolase [Planctomycetota bacterium]
MSERPPEPAFSTTVLEPAPGERVAVDLLDGARPTWLFLHGLGSVRAGEKSAALFRHAAWRGRAAARFDFRGHGDSTGTIGVATMSELIDDAAFVLERIGPAIVVGSSLGGLVGAHLAARRPDAVRALALLSPALGFLPRMRRRLDAAGRLRTSEDVEFAVHERALQDAERHDEDGLPARLPMPVFLAHGTDDELVPPALSERFAAAIPHDRKELWVVPGGDHRLSRDIDEILARMDSLFARHGALGAG